MKIHSPRRKKEGVKSEKLKGKNKLDETRKTINWKERRRK
jgi:hypothetical protein